MLSFLVSLLSLQAPSPRSAASRRAVLGGAAAATLAPLAAVADVRGANENVPTDERGINKLLQQQGLPPFKVKGGFTPLLEYIGTAQPANIDGLKARERAFKSTLLVRFQYPSGWLPSAPSITENGEAGNVGANNFIKGDSATFAALPLPKGKQLDELNKEFFKTWLTSQMANDVFEDVKVKKIRPVKQADGTEMVFVDFGYTLLTRAGFTVLRQGMASAMVTNDAVVGIVVATTQLRYKELADQIEVCTDSFRAYQVSTPAFAGSII